MMTGKIEEPEFLYKVVAGTSGINVYKFKIGSIAKKSITYMNGMTKRILKKDELNIYQLSEVSSEHLLNPGYIFTLENLELNKELLNEYSLGCLNIYKDSIEGYKNKLIGYINTSETLINQITNKEFDINIKFSY